MKTIVSSKGQVVIPMELRERDRITAGQQFEIERLGAGEYLLTRQPARPNEGLVDLLRACPATGWFQSSI